jgi:hypothetical protein
VADVLAAVEEVAVAMADNPSVVGRLSVSDRMEPAGVTGLVRWGGFVDEEFLPQLKGRRGRATYREMADNDPVCGAVLLAIDLLMRQVSFSIAPAEDLTTTGLSMGSASSNAAKIVADRVWGAMHDMGDTFDDTISGITQSMLTFGFSWNEEVYRYCRGFLPDQPALSSRFEDNWFTWSNLEIRAAETVYEWKFNDSNDGHGQLEGMVQQAAPDFRTRYIDAGRSLHFRTTAAKGNPEGRSIFRNAYRPWFYKRKIEEIEGIGIERDLAGLPIMWVPKQILLASASVDDKALAAKLSDMIRKVRRNEAEGLLLPLEYDEEGNKLYEFELATSGGSRQFDTNTVLQRKNLEIALSALADVLLMGHEKVGTQALGISKVDLFTAGLDAWLGQVTSEITGTGIPRLCRLNGVPRELWPTLEHGQIQQVDLDELGNFIRNLGAGGAPLWPNDALLGRLLELADLPMGTAGGGEL